MSLFGFASPSASATNLIFNLIAIPGGLWHHQREGSVLWPLALMITAGGPPGALVGAGLRTHAPAEQERFEPFVAAILLVLALATSQSLPAPTGVVAAPDWLLGTAFGVGALAVLAQSSNVPSVQNTNVPFRQTEGKRWRRGGSS